MSRIGKMPVILPEGVDAQLNNKIITVKGKNGVLTLDIVSDVRAEIADKQVKVSPANDSQRARAMWGLTRTLVKNMVTGVSEGFVKKLEIKGVGYRSSVDSGFLRIALGYSHEIVMAIPSNITVKTPKPTEIEVYGADKQRVGEFAASIRRLRKPEPYKGKGARYADEKIIMKEGKKK